MQQDDRAAIRYYAFGAPFRQPKVELKNKYLFLEGEIAEYVKFDRLPYQLSTKFT